MLHQCYENNGDLIKNKCTEYRVQNKDLKQKPGKVQYYAQNKDKT